MDKNSSIKGTQETPIKDKVKQNTSLDPQDTKDDWELDQIKFFMNPIRE